jgi:hypothetical protein
VTLLEYRTQENDLLRELAIATKAAEAAHAVKLGGIRTEYRRKSKALHDEFSESQAHAGH